MITLYIHVSLLFFSDMYYSLFFPSHTKCLFKDIHMADLSQPYHKVYNGCNRDRVMRTEMSTCLYKSRVGGRITIAPSADEKSGVS